MRVVTSQETEAVRRGHRIATAIMEGIAVTEKQVKPTAKMCSYFRAGLWEGFSNKGLSYDASRKRADEYIESIK